jgi:hypothetical protein
MQSLTTDSNQIPKRSDRDIPNVCLVHNVRLMERQTNRHHEATAAFCNYFVNMPENERNVVKEMVTGRIWAPTLW